MDKNAAADCDHGARNENEQDPKTKKMLVPKQELMLQSVAGTDSKALYADYELMQQQQAMMMMQQDPNALMMQQDPNAMMMVQQDPNAMMMQQDPNAMMMMQQHPQFDQQALAAQYMMAPSYYPETGNMFSGQMTYCDPNMQSA